MKKTKTISFAPKHHGQALVDMHSPVHFLVGFAAGVLGVDPHLAMATFVGAKIVDESLRQGFGHAVFGRESGQSLGNELADLMLEVGGLHAGAKLREHYTGQPAAVHGLGAYYQDPVNLPISGVGAYYQDPVNLPIAGLGHYRVR